MVENHLKEMILKTFDPKKADTIFTEEGETPAWLTELIEHPTWRSLIYRLAEEYPDCLMLNFTIKVSTHEKINCNTNKDMFLQLISDAGFQGEITSISTAAQQLEVFSRVLKTSIASFLTNPEDWQTTSKECAVRIFFLQCFFGEVADFRYFCCRKWFVMVSIRTYIAKLSCKCLHVNQKVAAA